jgi:hypothetical protein
MRAHHVIRNVPSAAVNEKDRVHKKWALLL